MKESWTYKKLGELCSLITKGTTPTSIGFDFTETGISFIKIESLTDDGGICPSMVAHISTECNNALKRSQLEDFDILYSIAGALGRVAIVPNSILPANTNQALAIIRLIDKNPTFIQFLKYFLQSNLMLSAVMNLKVGVAQQNLSLTQIRDLSVPVPSPDVQSHIVSELDILQSIINKQQTQLKELDNLAQAVFYDMFGDPVVNEKGWEVKRIDAIGDIVSGSTPSTTDESNWDGNVNWITPAEMSVQLYYGETQRKITEKAASRLTLMPVGTVLLSSRAPIGKLAIASIPMCCNQGFKNIICGKSMVNVFLYYYLMLTMDKVKALGRGVTFKEVSKQAISAYTTIVPPLSLQQSFAAKIESIEKQKSAISESIAETQKLFDYTMDKYFG